MGKTGQTQNKVIISEGGTNIVKGRGKYTRMRLAIVKVIWLGLYIEWTGRTQKPESGTPAGVKEEQTPS